MGCKRDERIMRQISLYVAKCSSVYDPDYYPACDTLKTSGAEAINMAWSDSWTPIRFLRPDNLIPFLYVRAFFINVRAYTRDRGKEVDVEDQNIVEEINKLVPHKKDCCEPIT